MRRSPSDADALVTVGAAQSNHCRMTAAAGAKLGLEVHLVLSGDEPARGEATGNQLLSALFGAQLHFTGVPDHHWGELEIARESVTDALAADGLRPYSIPIGGSTATGALGYAYAMYRAARSARRRGPRPVDDRVHVVERWHPRRAARRAGRRTGGGPHVPRHPRRRRRQGRQPRLSGHRRTRRRDAGTDGARRDRRRRATSRSTPGGSARTTPCPPWPATRRSAGRRPTAAG